MRSGRDGIDAVAVERRPHVVQVLLGELLRIMELVVVHQVAEALDSSAHALHCRLAGALGLVPTGHEAGDHRPEGPDAERGLHGQTTDLNGATAECRHEGAP
jgi:hypothetical protein